MKNIIQQLLEGLSNCDIVMDFTIMPSPTENPEEILKTSETELEKLPDPYEESSLYSGETTSDFETSNENDPEEDDAFDADFFPGQSPLTAIYLDTIRKLAKNSAEYQDIKEERDTMMDNRALAKLFSDEDTITLTGEELHQIQHYLFLEDRMDEMEQEALYFRGHADCLKYITRMDQTY